LTRYWPIIILPFIQVGLPWHPRLSHWMALTLQLLRPQRSALCGETQQLLRVKGTKVVVVTTCEGKKDRSGDPGFSEFLHVQFLCSLHKPIMYVYITCIYIILVRIAFIILPVLKVVRRWCVLQSPVNPDFIKTELTRRINDPTLTFDILRFDDDDDG